MQIWLTENSSADGVAALFCDALVDEEEENRVSEAGSRERVEQQDAVVRTGAGHASVGQRRVQRVTFFGDGRVNSQLVARHVRDGARDFNVEEAEGGGHLFGRLALGGRKSREEPLAGRLGPRLHQLHVVGAAVEGVAAGGGGVRRQQQKRERGDGSATTRHPLRAFACVRVCELIWQIWLKQRKGCCRSYTPPSLLPAAGLGGSLWAAQDRRRAPLPGRALLLRGPPPPAGCRPAGRRACGTVWSQSAPPLFPTPENCLRFQPNFEINYI